MKTAYYNIYRVLRTIIVTGIVTVISLFVILYLIFSIPQVQSKIKKIGEIELSKLLKTEVGIGRISISPFNQVVLYDVNVPDQQGKQLLKVEKIGAGVSIYNLITNKKLVFTYAEIIGLDGRINRATPKSPTNLQFIIDALSSKDKNKPPTKIDIALYNIVIRKSAVSYDVLSLVKKRGRFDKNHVKVTDLKADIELPTVTDNRYDVKVNRLSFKENCGFILKNITAKASIGMKKITIENLRIELPNTLITPEDLVMDFSDLKHLGDEIRDIDLNLNIPNSYICLADLAGFVPAFAKFNYPLNLTLATRGNLKRFEIPVLSITTDNQRLMVNVNGILYRLDNLKYFSADVPHILVQAKADEIAKLTANFAKLSPQADKIIKNCGNVNIDGSLKGNPEKYSFNGLVGTSLGNISLNGDFVQNKDAKEQGFSGRVSTNNFNIGTLLDKRALLDETAFNLKLKGTKSIHGVFGSVDGDIKYMDLNGYRYNDILANVDITPSQYTGTVSINDKNIKIDVDGMALLAGRNSQIDLKLDARHVNLSNLNLYGKYPNHNLSFQVDALFDGNDIDNANGHVALNNLQFLNDEAEGITLDRFEINADNKSVPNKIEVTSDVINGNVVGTYNFKSVAQTVKGILSQVFPSLLSGNSGNIKTAGRENDFDYNFKIENNESTKNLLTFFKSPVRLLYPITFAGAISEKGLSATIDAPFLQQKNKLIEGTRVDVSMGYDEKNLTINAQTLYPIKKGNVALNLHGNGVNDCLDTEVSWTMEQNSSYRGAVNLSAGLSRAKEDNSLFTSVSINPTEIVFNDTVWNVHPSIVNINHKTVDVRNFKISCDKQFVMIEGRVSPEEDDQLEIGLNDINLDYIFDILSINNVNFGGRATGRFYASNLYSKMPRLATPKLHVENLAYNSAILGNTDISSLWDNESKGVIINAKVQQSNGYESRIDGGIYPTKDSLCFDFNTKKVNIAFMKPFMSAITSDIQGEASGHARLYGNFHRINLLGDIFADDLKVKVDYTNVYYTVSDSIKIVPGLISFRNAKLHDRNGHTATMNGWVRHRYFHDASFDFSITGAQDFLCYDVTPKLSPDWYGTIYGNGSAFITGEPGIVNINVNMETAANSKFTFVMSNTEAANEYNFITFNDRNKKKSGVLEETLSVRDQIVYKFKREQTQEQKSSATVVNINLQAEVTPLAQMTLIMDPVGGDKIRAVGSGNLRMGYNSADDEMTMYGKYTLQKGSYNFTLQDIIIKDFTINEGSSIGFHGDPMAANIDIEAVYSLNANLQDLDESFVTDKELNRTNVPVHALLKVAGDIKQPNISFDLEFPTLTSDAYRKVRSIISTDDMMNRQIIYLLALNRFYTPDYMGGSGKSNELASVASSTISSQLSSMLGQLSDNWSISPNFRSDKGDFSDVEVELALSSQLLNNRLLFNGNFGYRDNAMNTRNSNFVGDFDIEYLLTKNGGVRLKAYNHYNDQNYYVKNALTTQGVGVVFKYDFNRPFDFLRKKTITSVMRTDTVADNRFSQRQENPDSIKVGE